MPTPGRPSPPLHHATIAGFVEGARLLIDRGADINKRDREGWTPLLLAARFNQSAMARFLIGAGADHSIALPGGARPIHLAAAEGALGVIAALAKGGEDLDRAASGEGGSPLVQAVINGKAKAARALLKLGADANRQGPDGFTPLHLAVERQDVSLARTTH